MAVLVMLVGMVTTVMARVHRGCMGSAVGTGVLV